VNVVPTTLAADSANSSSGVLGILAAGVFLAALGVPVFVARRRPKETEPQ
jgi:hypothetical protein